VCVEILGKIFKKVSLINQYLKKENGKSCANTNALSPFETIN
jgi:hypothetical protein